MEKTPGRRPRRRRLARALGLDRNPLRRASDRAEAWIRIGLLVAFLIAGPVVALSTGGWAYHAGITAVAVHAAPTRPVAAALPHPTPVPTYRGAVTEQGGGIDQDSQAWARLENTAASARSDEVLAVVITLALMAFTLLATMRLTRAFLGRRRLAAWEAAWSRVGPQWSRGRP